MARKIRMHSRRSGKSRGFTMIEILVGLLIMGVVAASLYSVLIESNHGERLGSTLTEAQQNLRRALDVILRDLRESGYGVDDVSQLPIEAASEYRVTFVIDKDVDGTIEPGERVTYFLEDDTSSPLVDDTANPYDVVLRRVISTAADSLADPTVQKGEVVAYGLTQYDVDNTTRSPGGTNRWNVRLFDYLDENGSSMVGGGTDPLGNEFGNTVPDSLIGGGGGMNLLRAIRVDLVAEGTHRDAGSGEFPRIRVTGTINPRNLNLGSRARFVSERDLVGVPGDSTGGGSDTTGTGDGTPTDSTATELPDYEPPIRIPTQRVLNLAMEDLNENDWEEGSLVTEGGQNDWDIIAGTSPGGTNNIEFYFAGIPDKYSGGRLYNSAPNYFGATSREIGELISADVDGGYPTYNDVIAAVATGDNTGGFELWLNQGAAAPGWVGTGTGGTIPDVFYTAGSGAGLDVAAGDMDDDGDVDIVLGTRTSTNNGKIEIWENDGTGVFSQKSTYTASGEVNAVVIADLNNDGWEDVAVGTKTSSNNVSGKVEVWLNYGTSFVKSGEWESRGKVNDMAAGDMSPGGSIDLVTGIRTGNKRGEVELWLNNGYGTFTLADYAVADDEVLCVAVGRIDYGNSSNDIVAGNGGATVQAWFCDADASPPSDIIPQYESWADANAGGVVHDLAIRKIEAGKYSGYADLLNDIVVGTSINASSGEIVLYLNPYVWTLNP